IKIAAEAVDNAEALNDRQREKVGDNPVIEVNITVGTTAITNLGGTVTVSVPYTPPATVAETDQDLLTVYYLDDDGNITEMKGAKYDAATGKITFATTHFSKFLISEWINPFDDIAKGEWFYKAARYAYSNALITGTTDTTFAPQATLTRAMLATILYRNAVGGGVPDAPLSDTPFTDVAPGQWYTPAIAWASSTNLITGVGDNKFSPNDPITREQFATLLYRYTQWSSAGNGTSRTPSPTDASLSAYTDAASVSDWAQEAMAWAVANGLITGRTETTLAPEIPATRAESAMLLQRYL
ncbi:MAG: S-layer homology domain-containing protein, partial [Oscillospiraceae bacterium]|nr:S-layer homology domain-containing protein [Oscillospiraceae bacterium]